MLKQCAKRRQQVFERRFHFMVEPTSREVFSRLTFDEAVFRARPPQSDFESSAPEWVLFSVADAAVVNSASILPEGAF
jgi:hypothetical protein